METPILTTKLYTPIPLATAIHRPTLIARLHQGLAGKLTVVAAPAGFGKSTLVSQWVCETRRPVTWLTLDARDNDPLRFLTYLVAAFQQIDAACGRQTLALIRSPQPPPLETILTTLLNEVALLPQPFLLVLDDYHLLTTEAVHQMINFWLTYQPPPMHLVIVSRHEPPLALARLRVRGELLTLSPADLRFSAAEVVEFFSKTSASALPPEILAALETRTEGWVAGLRLAAVALQGVNPAAHAEQLTAWLASFHGNDRHLFDYLTEEVFDRLAAEQQRFLVQTALLDRLCGGLCDAVTGNHDSQSLLEELARENLFLLPLDNQRQWYRYHSLFADFLRHRAQRLAPDPVAELHRRAANWYARQGLAAAAIDHAFAAHDYAQAMQLIEANVLSLALSNESATLARWLHTLPPVLVETRPLLAFAQAGTALLNSQFAQAKVWVETAERALLALPSPATLPLDAQTLHGYLDALRCTAMVNLHDSVTAIIAVAQRALRNLPPDERFLRGAVALNLGDAYCWQDENRLAADTFAEAVALTEQASNLTVHLAALGSQGELYARQGNLAQAALIYQRAIDMGQAWGKTTGQTHPVAGKAHAFYATILYEWNQLDAAEYHATTALDCCKRWGHARHVVDSYLALINSLYAQGKVEQANAALTAVRLVASEQWNRAQEQGAPLTVARELIDTVDHLQLSLWLRAGRLPDVARWLAEHTGDNQLAICFAHARLALAQHKPEAAAPWLPRIQQQLTHRTSQAGQLRSLLLQAQVHQQQDHPVEALLTLRAALALAESSGYVRLFLDEGAIIAELLHKLGQEEGTTAYRHGLLAAFDSAGSRSPAVEAPLRPTAALVEPLSEREREVLRLLAADLTYEAIGETLVISLNTVRTHTKNIYSKLNVNRRNQAITRARALGLVAPSV